MAGIRLSEGGIADRARMKEYDAKAKGASEQDIKLSRESGMSPLDIQQLRQFCAQRSLLIVFRCPKRAALAFHGDLPAKTWATKAKTNQTGTVSGSHDNLMVSDYDMMSMWRSTASGYQKIYVSSIAAPGAARGPWLKESAEIVRAMNGFLITKIQHGCQDDFQSAVKNPGVKMSDHFLAIRLSDGIYLRDPIFCENFYHAHGLFWPYDSRGKYAG